MRVLTLFRLLASSIAWGQSYTNAMYRRALEHETTSPLYVLVTLRDDAAGSDRVVCVLGKLFSWRYSFSVRSRIRARQP